MRQFRFIFTVLFASLLIINAAFWRKAIAVLLCGILSFNSASCYVLLNWSETANAATPPAKSQPAAVADSNDDMRNANEKAQKGKSDASEYQFRMVAKSDDTIDGKKVKNFQFESFGMEYNLLDEDGNAVYEMWLNEPLSGVQLFRNRERVPREGQRIDNFMLKAAGFYSFCRNGNLDVILSATDSAGAKKDLIARNAQGKWQLIQAYDPQHPTPPPASYLSQTCNINTATKANRASITSLHTDRFRAMGLKIPYAKLLGLPPKTHFSDGLFISQENTKGDVLLVVGVSTDIPGNNGAMMLLLGKPRGKNRALCIAKAVKWKSGKKNLQKQVDGIQHLLDAMDKAGISKLEEQAEVFANADQETAGFDSLHEKGGNKYFKRYEPDTPAGRNVGNTQKGDGIKYHGRGYVHVTGRYNYGVYGQNFLDNPDLMADPDIAAQITAEGMRDGKFRGNKLGEFYNKDGTYDYEGARDIINGDAEEYLDRHHKNLGTIGQHINITARQIEKAIKDCK